MQRAAELLLLYVAFYPVVTASIWIAGALIFRLADERDAEHEPPDGRWPGVTVLIPAHNERSVIALSVRAVLASDYPALELIVLDDGSVDGTSEAATEAAAGDPRCRVVRDETNRGKAEQLNRGFELASNELVAVTDADAHIHSRALKHLVSRLTGSPILAAVAAAPHVTNRTRLICAMQVLEAASIIGLIRRTQAVTGRVGTVAGVLGLFHRDRVVKVGGYDGRMATEDIDLTWRLLLAGWHTTYEPRALVGMQVPTELGSLWAQRKRWAAGQGEVLHVHIAEIARWRNYRMWMVGIESVASLLWVVGLVAAFVLAFLTLIFKNGDGIFAFGWAWGVAISVVATIQLSIALVLGSRYDRWEIRSFLVGPLYILVFWFVSAAAAIRCQVTGLLRGPRGERVVWDIQREET